MKKNVIIKNLTLLICVFTMHITIISQNTAYDLHNKYWYYKSRFNNNFISIGPDAGQSIPFNQRMFNETIFDGTTPKLKAGDATVQLGIYIGVLATEYRMLKDRGYTNDLPQVQRELYYALNAFNRLDYFSEDILDKHPLHPTNYSANGPSLNGFFIRDDIPKMFALQHYDDLNYYNENRNGILGYPALDINGTGNIGSTTNPIKIKLDPDGNPEPTVNIDFETGLCNKK